MLRATVQDFDVQGFGLPGSNVGALMIRIGFGGILYHNSNKEPPK